MNNPANIANGRRKRPRVLEANRRRVAKACESCRHVKEKCEGGCPCTRCTRLNRSCVFNDEPKAPDPHAQGMNTSDDEYIDRHRIAVLEEALKYYVPGLALDRRSLEEHIASLKATSRRSAMNRAVNTPSNSTTSRSEQEEAIERTCLPFLTMARSGELSHCAFFDSVQAQIDERSGKQRAQEPSPVTATVVSSRRAHLLSRNALALNAASSLPPIEVSKFLVAIFFRYAQTNYFYVDENSLRARLEAIYADVEAVTSNDTPPLCLLLVVLALGTQFAHLSSATDRNQATGMQDDVIDDMASPDDNVSLALYASATSLLADVLTVGSVESVQAFLLLGVYTLPIDAAGVSHTYLGTAVRLAIQNDMHRPPPKNIDAATAEQRIKIWWTTYTLEKRVSILHGVPVAVSRNEVDVPMPENDSITSHVYESSNNVSNYIAIINLTLMLEDVGATIWSLRHTPPQSRSSAVELLSRVHNELSTYWYSLPDVIVCRDLSPSGPLFRPNVHLALMYHLIRLFIGRTFIFDVTRSDTAPPPTQSDSPSWTDLRAKLIHETINSAVTIVKLCQLLYDEVGLARASYTEFTSCRTAVLSILAWRTQENSLWLQTASEQGLELLKFMSVGIYSATAEKVAIRAMETAVRRLNHKARIESTKHKTGEKSAYDNFCNWARLWSKDGAGHVKTPASQNKSPYLADTGTSDDSSNLLPSSLSPQTNDLNTIMSIFPFDLDEFNSMSGYDPDFTFNMNFPITEGSV